ncbi:MAG: Twitching motility protein [Candidatus Falkowbacteria bacterium GW2011_GWC2_38_22]|uniref:Twitching motility protein n=1 Tax=Candidatus Falkowbacteria bacterium GW2011_GWE1_38_31 TaxID=1618638 RepID=A0A0G0K692_9BACT|nr:MAG: Twitching motility protein [Candidatus Falkowbacteria bacterium GW2011_GWF2_38_1205]KKQ62150.1 MAG: Twitching motility protein [Candidatus Falkowbacteria bacterium GW2011_GWC2_38_22]KKQ64300.1 MAG: Twitching motility protein [Candidatus Falkowbacteria bacterium GW2011_GWF1_38_22]KKQ66277.1 MAG: Twitching motility protein [Candidatus Falkowbacteria bacterium GW2011_GWE2_38_254]KKQ71005.1 MAG: Twitching motility protein [Candidatus Falkowbacteria bacterium GW2011_GWE1_38_31]KKQ73514.1 MA
MEIEPYFKSAIENNASDLHLVEGSIPALRVSGELIKFNENPIPFGELRHAINLKIDKNTRERFERKRDLDLSMVFFKNRFRVNLHFQDGKIGLTARLVPIQIPTPKDIRLTETIYALTHLKDGLILVTGASGTGKSTTLAVMLDIINTERRSHIITIEDPIEYDFQDKQSIVEQRQLGRDTSSFADALKYALRQDPNVIMVGEMRDLDTISAALTAAKTGHLVLSTLHTATAAETVERIVDFFPSQNQGLITGQLSTVLRAVISQQLLPKKDGGLIAAREILINNRAIANLIRNNQVSQIGNAIQTGGQEGMITMNKAIDNLFQEGLITEQVARNRKRDLETQAAYY